MSKYDAERALNIYKTFGKQTNQVVDYLSTARSYENATRLEIPKLKHAPTSLTGSLEEYLNDPDFEVNRRQYLAQQRAQKGRKNMSNGNGEGSNVQPSRPQTQLDSSPKLKVPLTAPPTPPKAEPTGPAPDLIDLFSSIEQNQQPMTTQSQPQIPGYQVGQQLYQPSEVQQQQQPQQAGFPPEPQNFYVQNGQAEQQAATPLGNLNNSPFAPFNPQMQAQAQQPPGPIFSGAGFGNYPQPLYVQTQTSYSSSVPNNYSEFTHQQTSLSSSQQPQSTNPFRQSVLPQPSGPLPSATTVPPLPSQPYQSTNPFAKTITPQPTASTQQPFMSPQSQPSVLASPSTQGNQFPPFQSPQLSPPPQVIQPNLTGTNPFARNISPSTVIPPAPTGSTNPFRQTPFAPKNTWQANQGTIGGLEQLETVPVFPRPGQISQGPGQGQGWP